MIRILVSSLLTVLFLSVPAFADNYVIDPAHTYIGFSAKHMVITNVKGRFKEFFGGFNFDEKSKTLKDVKLNIAAKSIDTEVEKRDNHLRSPDFLDVTKHPIITFVMKDTGFLEDNKLWMVGDLTIHGVTDEIRLKGEFLGSVKDFKGKQRVGFTGTGKLDRFNYGLQWNKLLELGGAVVSREIKLIIEVEGVKQ